MADAVASSVASGAAQGAVIGSVVPGIGTAVGAIVGGVYGLITGITGDRQVEEVRKAKIKAEKLSLYEDLRRLEKAKFQTTGDTQANAAAAGVSANVGSPLALLAEQASEFDIERNFMVEQSMARRRLINLGAEAELAQMNATNLQSAMSAYVQYSEIGYQPSGFTNPFARRTTTGGSPTPTGSRVGPRD